MLTQHPIYVNIKMLRKPETEAQEQKVTKLAIGKPGGVDMEEDKYDTIPTVICKACDKALDITNNEVSNMASSIILA
jgi:hypothetical protein